MNGRSRMPFFNEEYNKPPAVPPRNDLRSSSGSMPNVRLDRNNVTTVIASTGDRTNRSREIRYTDTEVIGNGSFGVVYKAQLCDSNEMVAIKRVLQDKKFKNRELQIMLELEHCNIIKLKYYFYSSGVKRSEVYLNLILEFVPETVFKFSNYYTSKFMTIPINFVKLFMYQLFRGLAYIHSIGVVHRDLKPQNLLVDQRTGVLKLCDFGSAKRLVPGEKNVSYICSRYYRAPELIFSSTNYNTKIDIWSAGCVMGELLLGKPMFCGDTSIDQLVEIIKVMGTPTSEQVFEMNPVYVQFDYPKINRLCWSEMFKSRQTPSEALNLLDRLLAYKPSQRLSPLEVCVHTFFDELRDHSATLPNGRQLPPLFNFTEYELKINPELNNRLMPKPNVTSDAGSVSGARSAIARSQVPNTSQSHSRSISEL